MQEEDELQMAAFLGNNHAELQVAVSFPKHVAVITNIYMGPRDFSFAEFGAGYYTNIGKDLVAEVYAGYGHASNHMEWDKKTGNIFDGGDREYYFIDADYDRLFVQANLGMRVANISFALSIPYHRVSYPKYEYKYRLNDYDYYASNPILSGDTVLLKNHIIHFFNPAVTFKAGWQYFTFFSQISSPIYISKNLEHPLFQPGLIALGIQFRFRYKSDNSTDD